LSEAERLRYIRKPIEIDVLSRKVREILEAVPVAADPAAGS
jgi:hypothetical protein